MLKLNCRPLAFILYNVFLKSKNGSGTILPASFSVWFLKENVSLVMFY